MQYNGHVIVPHGTFDAFRSYVLNNGFDWDGENGDQCYDGVQLIYGQYGKVLQTGPNHAAYECWTYSRAANSVDPFTSISKGEIKRGDIVVFSNTQYPPYGHIGYADEDYTGQATMRVLGENQGGTPYSEGGAYFNLANFSTANILGGFRNKNWDSTPPLPPTPTPSPSARSRFPWPIYWQLWKRR